MATIASLDAEIRSFESKLTFALNPESLPDKGSGVLAWPLKSVLVTQRFGRTISSERLYVSGSHSGTDFRAAVGTPVYAVADGVVKGVGDTDATCPNASFGKWVFIEHDNGLSTTSGHLSKWKVSSGQQVKKGDIIAYSGNTGRSTAPHLHLTVYATKGVDGEQGARITDRASGACAGKTYRMPLAPTSAYLDPLAYLPKTTSANFKHN
jgi:murein DD-endopeptidase MepM/ murein hydrolase activator NlpD